ncbi:MAG: DUF1015 family protein [Actinomycetota bacterium]
MPTVRPFHGIRYADSDELKDLTCPPYDVISPDEQAALHDRHPNNAVRLELARSEGASSKKYAHVAGTFDDWVRDGVLHRDEQESLYVYRQDFVDPTGTRRRVVGILGALRLEEFGTDSGVLPHERTMAGPIQDRLALMRALPVNVSPIFAIYRGKGELGPFFDSLEHRPTDARFVDDTGILHRLWVTTAPAEIEMLTGALAPGPLVIADGHHRYETALAFHNECAGQPGAHDAIMCFCVDADAEGLVVLPYNRAVKSQIAPASIETALRESFGGRDFSGEPARASEALRDSPAKHPFVFVLSGKSIEAEVTEEQVIARTGERHEAWLALDVVALHEALLPDVFGDTPELRFSKDPGEIVRLVREEGWSAGVLLRSLDAAQVVDVASSGERMPQKASYFWPKAITGLVFRSLR